MVFHSHNTCLNFLNVNSFFSGGIINSSTFFEFFSTTGFYFTILSAILFPINSPVASAALWTICFEAVFKASIHVSNN